MLSHHHLHIEEEKTFMPGVAAKDLTIGVCHSAYRIAPVIKARLPEVRVFQEWSTAAMQPRMPSGCPGSVWRLA